MTIKEVYEKYKHFDRVLNDEEWIKNTLPASDTRSFKDCLLFELWQAIKEEMEERKKEEGIIKEESLFLLLQERIKEIIKENAPSK